jgi:hypothetical protein
MKITSILQAFLLVSLYPNVQGLKKLPLLVLLGLLAACETEKAPDPCEALKPVSADFDLYDGNTKIDTFVLPATVTFKAKDSTAQSYEWSFPKGENTSDKRQFTLTFHNEMGLVPVQLILKNKPQTACFPKDDGIDTVQKSVYLLHWMEVDRLPYIGTFVGSDDINPNHKFEVHIKDFGKEDPDPIPDKKYWIGLRIFNLPEGCGRGDTTMFSWSPQMGPRGYKNFVADAGTSIQNNCGALGAKGISINKDKIVIDYNFQLWNPNKQLYELQKRKFTGYRKK